MAHAAFVISTPLQLIVTLAIIDEMKNKTADLLVVNTFLAATETAHRFNEKSGRQQAALFEDQAAAYRHVLKSGYDDLFIDSDVGVQKFRTLRQLASRSPHTRIHVFEEGIGTYRNDLYRGLKRRFLSALGVGTAFGKCKFTRSIHVFEPARYEMSVGSVKAEVIPINANLSEFVSRRKAELAAIFGYTDALDTGGQQAALYLSGWDIDHEALSAVMDKHHHVVLKLHPHYRGPRVVQGVTVAPMSPPAEFIVLDLLEKGPLTVYHHGSSTAHYLASSGAEFVTLNELRSN